MPYSRDFFSLQVSFAQALTRRFEITVEDALFSYTPFALNFDRDRFQREVTTTTDPAEWAFNLYERTRGAEAEPNTIYAGHQLFGRFYYELRAGHIIRPHIAPVSSYVPLLASQSRPVLLADLKRMFESIRDACPDADTVLGNSWLYNLPRYQSLFPPAYTHNMSVSTEDEFHYLALWGQFFERNWRVRENSAQELLRRVAELDDLNNLLHCFPFQILMPRCEIKSFYEFYEESPQTDEHPPPASKINEFEVNSKAPEVLRGINAKQNFAPHEPLDS